MDSFADLIIFWLPFIGYIRARDVSDKNLFMCCSPKLKGMSQRENIYWSMDFASIFLKEWLWKNVNDRTCKVTNSTPVLWNHTGGAHIGDKHCTSIFWLHKCLPLTVWNQTNDFKIQYFLLHRKCSYSEMRLFPEAVGRLLSHKATCYFPPHRVTIQPFEL